MLKIYDYKGFPNPTRVRIALAEKGLSDRVEFISIDVPGGEHRLPTFAKKNPYATVPVLELEDGTCISECTAITEYVDNLVGEPVLTGKSAKDRAVIHMSRALAAAYDKSMRRSTSIFRRNGPRSFTTTLTHLRRRQTFKIVPNGKVL